MTALCGTVDETQGLQGLRKKNETSQRKLWIWRARRLP